jgi:ABC-type transporter Mla subunit MlaD
LGIPLPPRPIPKDVGSHSSEAPQKLLAAKGVLSQEDRRLHAELSRLTSALADGVPLTSVLDAIRERESRREAIARELATLTADGAAMADEIEAVLPEAKRRLDQWRSVLVDEMPQARRMLRALLTRAVSCSRPNRKRKPSNSMGRVILANSSPV